MAHFLLIYDRSTGRLLRQTEFGDRSEGMQARFAAETEFRGRPEVEIVAFDAESEDQLRRTHARYFLSLSELAARRG